MHETQFVIRVLEIQISGLLLRTSSAGIVRERTSKDFYNIRERLRNNLRPKNASRVFWVLLVLGLIVFIPLVVQVPQVSSAFVTGSSQGAMISGSQQAGSYNAQYMISWRHRHSSTTTTTSYTTTKTTSTSSGSVSISFSITPLAESNGKYSNVQTATITNSAGQPIAGVAVTYYENAGTSGGYYHGTTNSAGQTVEKDVYPGAGSYTEWAVAIVNGQTLTSQKITVIVP